MKKREFKMGDRVWHFNRGKGTFECYRTASSCMVRFDNGLGGEEVTLSLVRKQRRKQN